MPRIVGAAVLLLVLSAPVAAQPPGPYLLPPQTVGSNAGHTSRGLPRILIEDRAIDQFEDWLGAIADHTPGADDEAETLVASWPGSDLRTLWVNASVLLRLMGELRTNRLVQAAKWYVGASLTSFTVSAPGQPTREVAYSPDQLRRLKLFACVAAGRWPCLDLLNPNDLRSFVTFNQNDVRAFVAQDPKLDRVVTLVAEAKKHGDSNVVLRRGAMLHADVAMQNGPRPVSADSDSDPAPQQLRIHLLDGRETMRGQVEIHWVIGRLLLDAVMPEGASKPAPGGDAMVRRWYQATATWMVQQAEFDIVHLEHARRLFPGDALLLFLSGTQSETFASPFVQDALAELVAPQKYRFSVDSASVELRRAEGFLRDAVKADPAMADARLHLGHVLLEERHYRDAATALQGGTGWSADESQQYYRWLFLGSAEEGLRHDRAARDAYERAGALTPPAQSPPLALAELAFRRGDRRAAIDATMRLAALPAADEERVDPWWQYYASPGRDAQVRLDDLRRQVQPN